MGPSTEVSRIRCLQRGCPCSHMPCVPQTRVLAKVSQPLFAWMATCGPCPCVSVFLSRGERKNHHLPPPPLSAATHERSASPQVHGPRAQARIQSLVKVVPKDQRYETPWPPPQTSDAAQTRGIGRRSHRRSHRSPPNFHRSPQKRSLFRIFRCPSCAHQLLSVDDETIPGRSVDLLVALWISWSLCGSLTRLDPWRSFG